MNNEIVTRTQRMSNALYERIKDESDKTGNSISNEINSLIADGLRLREAQIIVQIQEK